MDAKTIGKAIGSTATDINLALLRELLEKGFPEKEPAQYTGRRESGSPYRLVGREMRTVTEGVTEIDWNSRRIAAALETDGGPVVFEGGRLLGQYSDDVQSGPSPVWHVSLERANDAIRQAYDSLSPSEALSAIARIREELDRCSELAAARSRLLLGKLDPPGLCETPDWFVSQKAELVKSAEEDGDILPAPWVLDSAELLIRAVLVEVERPEACVAELGVGPLGRLIVDWRVGQGRLRWMVDATEVSWPAVRVFQLRRSGPGSLETLAETRIMYNAFDVVKETREHMRANRD